MTRSLQAGHSLGWVEKRPCCLSLHLLGPQVAPGVLKGPIVAQLTMGAEGSPSSPLRPMASLSLSGSC